MKKYFFLSLLLLVASNVVVFSQTSGKLNEDEITRVKFNVHLITYDTVGAFDNAAGESYYLLVLNSFKENLSIPQFAKPNLTEKDKNKIEIIIQQLNKAKQNPPTWDDLFANETKYLIWKDKVTHKKSKYKVD
jgi:hypothetical protein